MAQQSARRGRKNQGVAEPFPSAQRWMIRPANSILARSHALLIEAGQTMAFDCVPTYPDRLLASNGPSADAVRSARIPYLCDGR